MNRNSRGIDDGKEPRVEQGFICAADDLSLGSERSRP